MSWLGIAASFALGALSALFIILLVGAIWEMIDVVRYRLAEREWRKRRHL